MMGDGRLSYTFKPSLNGALHRFELMDDGLSWQVSSKAVVWAYGDIASVRLSYRPVAMQRWRFRCDIGHRSGQRVAILSTNWKTVALMEPQNVDYRAFIVELHRRMANANSAATLECGLRRGIYVTAVAAVVTVALAIAALLVRALLTREFAGALFLVGFAALFGWQVGGFVRRNTPQRYAFDAQPERLLP